MTYSPERVGSGSALPTLDDTETDRDYRDRLRAFSEFRRSRRLANLRETVEAEVVPRVVEAHRAAGRDGSASILQRSQGVGATEAMDLAGMLVHRGVTEAASFVESRYKAGVPLESLYLDLLAPAARHLGILWEQDICDFGEVTVGLCNLRQVVRELSPLFLLGSGGFDPRRRALFLTMPGDQHSFGLYLVAEFFRRAGWVVSTGTPNSRHEVSQLVGRESFAIVGLSVGCGTRLDTVATCIQAIRHLSRNKAVGVFVGGPAFVETPRYVSVVGADGTAPDASQAVMKAEAFIAGVQDLGL